MSCLGRHPRRRGRPDCPRRFFWKEVGLTPIEVQAVFALAPAGIAALAQVAQRVSKRFGRIQTTLATKLCGIALLVSMTRAGDGSSAAGGNLARWLFLGRLRGRAASPSRSTRYRAGVSPHPQTARASANQRRPQVRRRRPLFVADVAHELLPGPDAERVERLRPQGGARALERRGVDQSVLVERIRGARRLPRPPPRVASKHARWSWLYYSLQEDASVQTLQK